MSLTCVIHYRSLKPFSGITPLSADTHKKLKKNREARERLGGPNEHADQCESIPNVLDVTVHGYHRKCYQKFTKGVVIERKRKSDGKKKGSSKAKRPKRTGEGAHKLFPNMCMFCKTKERKRIYVKKQRSSKYEHIKLCELPSTEDRIVEAAELSNDIDMQALVVDRKLREREFKFHPSCQKEYTRVVDEKVTEVNQLNEIDEKFPDVIRFVKSNIIEGGRVCSMAVLAEMIWKDKGIEKKVRAYLKKKLQKEFPDELLFLNVTYHDPQLVMHKSCASNNTMLTFMQENKKCAVKESAKFIREEILDMLDKAPTMNWPPKVDALLDAKRQPPELVQTFLKCLLHDTHHSTGNMVESLIWSYSNDLVYGVSKGKFMTSKHTLLANVLHTLTGQRIPIDLVSAFGNCGSYNLVQLTETAQAELVQNLRQHGFPLPVLPETDEDSVITHFWWDNFDVKKENKSGGIHTTHGVAFQEQIEGETKMREVNEVCVEGSGKRTVKVQQQELPYRKVVKHLSPTIKSSGEGTPPPSNEAGNQCILLWKLARRIHSEDEQCISRFVGWVTKLHQKASKKTCIVYLPPIRNPINEYSTVVECIFQSQELAKTANMRYTHITADAGAAAKFYQVVWNNVDEFKNVLVHLGDLHGFMEFFGMIGKQVMGGGFEDTIYQAELCTTGSVNKILSGKHYNKAWLINECFAEAIDRLFCEKYVPIDDDTKAKLRAATESLVDVSTIFESQEMKDYIERYNKARKECTEGKYGKTAQFWMGYSNAVERLHILHFAINTNDFNLRMKMWEEAIAGCFTMGKVNYARFGTYYVMQMQNLDQTHPGAREELEKNGMSVCRNELNIRQSIDGAGESTFMKDAKIVGGIKNFSTQDETYEKWVLSRAGQAEYKSALFKLAGMSTEHQEPRKCLRPTEVKKSEQAVQNLVQVLKETFLNPFSDDLANDKLYNLASGCPVTEETTKCLLTVETRGRDLMNDFKKRISGTHDKGKKLFDPITESKWHGFSSNNAKRKVKVNGKEKDIAVQRDILGALVANSQNDNSPVDLDEALSHPLAVVSLPLASADGVRRKTNKSKFYDVLDPVCPEVLMSRNNTKKYLIYDLAAALRSMVVTPHTFKELGMKLLNEITQDYKVIYVACDTYKNNTIKQNERVSRGVSEKFTIRSSSVRIPSDFQNFLNNGDNKERLFQLIEEVWCENRVILGDRVIYFARSQNCTKIEATGSFDVHELSSNHEEADTKVVYLLKHAIDSEECIEDASFIVRSSSGDIDIPIILLSNDLPEDAKIILDSGRDKHRRRIHLHGCTFSDEQKKALLGIHAFSGCDQISSFLRKGKITCWKVLEKNPHLFQAFALLGTEQEVSEELIRSLEEYVCKLYGEKRCSSVNVARRNIFWRSLKKKKKIIDLSLLPPCKLSLVYHIRRANYLCFIWRQASVPWMIMDVPQNHGWDENCDFKWSDLIYPASVATFLENTGSINCSAEQEEDTDLEEDDVNDIFDVDEDEDLNEEHYL